MKTLFRFYCRRVIQTRKRRTITAHLLPTSTRLPLMMALSIATTPATFQVMNMFQVSEIANLIFMIFDDCISYHFIYYNSGSRYTIQYINILYKTFLAFQLSSQTYLFRFQIQLMRRKTATPRSPRPPTSKRSQRLWPRLRVQWTSRIVAMSEYFSQIFFFRSQKSNNHIYIER